MGIPELKNLSAAFSLALYFNWLIGLSFFRPPNSRPVRIMVTLYSCGIWVFCAVAYYIGIRAMNSTLFYDSSPMAIVMYQVLVYTNVLVGLMVPLFAWIKYKGLNDYIDRMEELDDTFGRLLGSKKNYNKLFLSQLYYILTMILITIATTIIDLQWLMQKDTPLVTNLAILITVHHPILIMLVTDLTFCGLTRLIGKRFRDVNKALHGLTEPDFVLYPFRGRLVVAEKKSSKMYSVCGIVNGGAKTSTYRRDSFQIIRKSHFELSKLAEKMNSIFGIQNLMSVGVSLVMVTGLLYTIYSTNNWKHTIHDRVIEVLPPACWCIIYSFKILIVSHTCASVSDEAEKSGRIIYEVLGLSTDKEFRREIQEFALQMIQNPVRFTASGFCTLDHTYVRGVIGSITTYLVILIQMSNTSPSASTPTANKTYT